MNMTRNGWVLGVAFSVLLMVPSCTQVKELYKKTFPHKVTHQDGSPTVAEEQGKTAPKKTEPMVDQDPRTTTDSGPFSLKWSW
jgi:hypothetical protein